MTLNTHAPRPPEGVGRGTVACWLGQARQSAHLVETGATGRTYDVVVTWRLEERKIGSVTRERSGGWVPLGVMMCCVEPYATKEAAMQAVASRWSERMRVALEVEP